MSGYRGRNLNRTYHMDMNGEYVCEYDQTAKWVNPGRTRTKDTHPYSYDEFFHFGSRAAIERDGVAGNYSDRLREWDSKKFDRLWKEHVNTRWDLARQDQLTAFMSDYQGKRVEVVAMAEGCNASNGYPYFIVWHKE